MTHASKTPEERKMMAAFVPAKDYAEMASEAAAKADTLHADGHLELRDEWIHRAQVAASEAADAVLRLEAQTS